MDLSFLASPEAWISLVTLVFLEIILGVDNIVFIILTSDRLAPEKQHIGRKLGLAGAFVSRAIFLCFASYLVHMTNKLFTLPFNGINGEPFGMSVRDIVLFLGGAYLIYKGVTELRGVLNLEEEKADHDEKHSDKPKKPLSLPGAVATIMVMDVVFSIDSVITAVGLANQLLIMIFAVMLAIILMMVFIDSISDFINAHAEMKMLALCFITVIGLLLFLDGLGIHSNIEVFDMHVEKLMVYFAMVFSVIICILIIRRNQNYANWQKELAEKGLPPHEYESKKDEKDEK